MLIRDTERTENSGDKLCVSLWFNEINHYRKRTAISSLRRVK
jgi:hypothetical protein